MFEEFLTPLRIEDIVDTEALSPDQLGSIVDMNLGTAPDIEKCDIVIIGVNDDRGTPRNKGCAKAPDAIRKQLYQLYTPNKHVRIADLGNLEKGATLRDTYIALSKIVLEVLYYKCVPVVIGGGHDLTYGHYGGYQETGRMINLAIVDAVIDIKENEEDIDADNFLITLLTHQPNFLFNYSQVAYQTHFASQHTVETLDKLHFDMVRLGKVRDKISDLEPLLRDTDMLSFDMNAVKFGDAPGNKNATPNGLTGEDACQIARYAGLSDKLTSFGLYEVNPVTDTREQTVLLAAQMIWYFVEGYYNRRKLVPSDDDRDFTKYHVHFKEINFDMVFWKNLQTDLWWMEVPSGHKSKRPDKKHLVPCSYDDYQLACREEVPERWLKTHEKLS